MSIHPSMRGHIAPSPTVSHHADSGLLLQLLLLLPRLFTAGKQWQTVGRDLQEYDTISSIIIISTIFHVHILSDCQLRPSAAGKHHNKLMELF
jgi:hypothetical protein